jgi:hypothetical protein
MNSGSIMNRNVFNLLTALAFAAATSTGALAVPTTVTFLETPKCDVLSVPPQVDELGTNVFPLNELISSQFLGTTTQTACVMNAGLFQGYGVQITNLSGINWGQVWYCGNTETAISNDDGLINGEEGFLINNAAGDLNKPLIFESTTNDGIFQAGETWRFLIDGYGNTAALPPSAFGNIGVPDPLGSVASGNIIATQAIPEPSAMATVLLGACALLAARSRCDRRSAFSQSI